MYANWKTGQIGIPSTGILSDGRTVSGYNKLPMTQLADEGWMVAEDDKPIYDAETHELVVDSLEVVKQGVDTFDEGGNITGIAEVEKCIVHYVAVAKPEPEPSYKDLYEALLAEMEAV